MTLGKNLLWGLAGMLAFAIWRAWLWYRRVQDDLLLASWRAPKMEAPDGICIGCGGVLEIVASNPDVLRCPGCGAVCFG